MKMKTQSTQIRRTNRADALQDAIIEKQYFNEVNKNHGCIITANARKQNGAYVGYIKFHIKH
jgi:hypothetical protein